MPPLGPEVYKGIPKNEARIALHEREERLRRNVYDKMIQIANRPRLKVANYPFSDHVHYETPSAVYRTEEQSESELTRAWLTLGPSGNVALHTDQINLADSEATTTKDDETVHFILSEGAEDRQTNKSPINIFTHHNHYREFDVEQYINLWGQVDETIDLIQAATEATGRRQVAAYPEEPWPIKIPEAIV